MINRSKHPKNPAFSLRLAAAKEIESALTRRKSKKTVKFFKTHATFSPYRSLRN
jgi:hypothetical protein